MSGTTWSLQEAKNRFSAVVEAARHHPQTVTKHGKPAVVILDVAEYRRLEQLEQLGAPSFSEHLLAFPVDDCDLDRLDGELRESEF